MGWSSTLPALGVCPAAPPLPSGWDQELLLSPGLAGTGRPGLGGVLLALAVVPSALGRHLGVICIRAEAKVKQPLLLSAVTNLESHSILTKVYKIR